MKLKSLITPILYIVVGLILILFPSITFRVISYLVAIVLILTGVIAIANYFTKAAENEFQKGGLALGLIAIAVACFLFVKPDTISALLPTVLSFGIILSGLLKLESAIALHKIKYKNWLAVLIASLVCIAYGIVLLLVPDTLIIMLGIGIAFGGLTDLVSALLYHAHNKRNVIL